MKPPLRTKSVGTKVSEAEFALLEERARGAGMRLGEWVREALLSAPAESGPDSGEVALSEVLALRSLLLNLHFRSATIPEAEMRGLIERADGSKLERARERCLMNADCGSGGLRLRKPYRQTCTIWIVNSPPCDEVNWIYQ
jgi:hypothetical protein